MKSLSTLGLTLFLTGFAVFILILTLGQFRLTEDALMRTLKPEHRAVLQPRLAPMLDQTYSNQIGFISDLNGAIEGYNNEVRAKQQWDKVIYDNYTFPLTQSASVGTVAEQPGLWFWLSIGLATLGGLVYILFNPKYRGSAGIRNNHLYQHAATDRGWIGWLFGTFLIGFYILLYKFPEYLTNWTLLVSPVKQLLGGKAGEWTSQWFLYGFLYTVVILVMGVRMLLRYRHSRYQQWRTASVMFFQTAFAFLIPEILSLLNQPYQDLKSFWPLDYDFFFDYEITAKIQAGTFGIFMLVWGIIGTVVVVPVLTYFYGKRWYCSWVCGCGGLAETLGDPHRQLSDKSLRAWKAERVLVHGVLAFAVVMTGLVLYTYFTGQSTVLGFLDSYSVRGAYGFYIGTLFSGVIGTGFYPIMGNRVWCRFGCPLAAYLGLVQRFKSRFRITTNGGQCISCGNCSAYCEMGIDVRAYAQRGQDIVRSSCVGCGICSAVCPRGVLNLETGRVDTRRI
jgi:ferredoxin-type protein NapH